MDTPSIPTSRSKIRRQKAARELIVLAVVILACIQLSAQTPNAAGPPVGSVAGNVVIEGTQQPVSFARIQLVPKPASLDPDNPQEQAGGSNPPIPHVSFIIGRAELNGAFRMDGVPGGDYFVGAISPGFIGPYAAAGSNASDAQLRQLLPSWPTVHVAAGQVSTVDLILRRGGVIAGRVQFADGSPAIDFPVACEVAEQNLALASVRLAKITPLQHVAQAYDYRTLHRREIETDDRGRFRIFGLPPGNYLVTTVLPTLVGAASQVLMSDGSSPTPDRPGTATSSMPPIVEVYAPGVFRRSQAKIFRIRGSEQVQEANLKIDPTGLLTVKGRVRAGEDFHVPANAVLLLKEDGGQDLGRIAGTDNDGSFELDYVSPGKYTLELMGANDEAVAGQPAGAPQVLRRYKMPKRAVIVTNRDLDLGDIVLDALRPGEKMEFPE